MDAIQFVNSFTDMVSEIELMVKPEYYPAITKLYESDPHDLISPDAYFPTGSAIGYVWKLFIKECKTLNLLF